MPTFAMTVDELAAADGAAHIKRNVKDHLNGVQSTPNGNGTAATTTATATPAAAAGANLPADSTADNTTAAATNGNPHSVDLSHHLSLLARSRRASPLKDIIRYMAIPGIISLAGGLPSADYFPFHSISSSIYPPSTVLDPESGVAPSESLEIVIGREPTPNSRYCLAGGLQYTGGNGLEQFADFCRKLTARLWEPAYADWDVLVNSGGTDAWTKVCTLLLERGDHVITDREVYPSAQASFIPMGVKALAVEGDDEGMRADKLDEALTAWDPARGRRPRVVYLVPTGQNPLGSTLGTQRRKDIYEVCVKYDVVIIEDDPYTVLQFEPWVQGAPFRPPPTKADVEGFLSSMVKSFLTIDYQGRVIRLDTFSKTLAPGARLGWFTANSMFTERLLRGTEVQTQMPSGISEVVIGEMLDKWGMDGYLEWITNLREQYRVRRDWMLDALADCFDLVPAEEENVPGAMGLVAYAKGTKANADRRALLSFVPCVAGMFIWCRVHYSTHPGFAAFVASYKGDGNVTQAFEEAFWLRLVDAKVLVTPGWYFTAWEGDEAEQHGEEGVGGFRLAFSFETKHDQEEGIRRLASVMVKDWGV